jgi:hypothetical protein
VGPLLVWQASKTARNQALAALDSGLADSNGFVTKGVRFGRDIRLFRRVRAPDLRHTPKLHGRKPLWDLLATLPTKESAGWVQLGAALQAYKFPFDQGDCLILRDGRSVLNVSRIWLVIIGLVGRFGRRKDQGKWPTKRPRGVQFGQAVPGLRLGNGHNPKPRIDRISTPAPDDFRNWTYERGMHHGSSGLHGLTGTMRQSWNNTGLEFQLHPQHDVGQLSEEVLDVAALFWLAVGCLPSFDNNTVYSLEDVQYQTADHESEVDDDDESGDPLMMAPPNRRDSFGPQAHFHDPQSHMPAGAIPVDPFPYPPPPPVFHQDRAEQTYPSYFHSNNNPVDDRRPARSQHKLASDTPRMLHFSMTYERAENLFDLAEAVGAEATQTRTMSLAETTITADELVALQDDLKRTFVPCDRPWIRLVRPTRKDTTQAAFFLIRADAQMIARALLQLPICAQGYLIYRARGSLCRRMLVDCCELLPRLLSSMLVDFDVIRSPGTTWDKCLPRFSMLLRLTENYYKT